MNADRSKSQTARKYIDDNGRFKINERILEEDLGKLFFVFN